MPYYKRLRDLREDNDKTQKEIATILNMKQQQYLRYEKGERDTPSTVLIELAKLYNTSIDYILELTDEIKPYPTAKENKVINNNINIHGGANNSISFGNINIK